MADILESLYGYLSTQSEVTDLVSTRIYPDFAPAGRARPYVVFYEDAQVRFPYMGGDSSAIVTTIYLEAWGDKRTDVRNVREAIRDVMNGFQRKSMESLYISFTELQEVYSDYEIPEDGRDTPVFVEQSVYTIAYKESLTTA